VSCQVKRLGMSVSGNNSGLLLVNAAEATAQNLLLQYFLEQAVFYTLSGFLIIFSPSCPAAAKDKWNSLAILKGQ
jgi:hypothetical protein